MILKQRESDMPEVLSEANLVITDDQGNPVAMWRKHPKLRVNVLYKLKEMSLSEIEHFGPELYPNERNVKYPLEPQKP